MRATTLLGDNTIPLLRELVGALGDAGIEVGFDDEVPFDEREASVDEGSFDLVWACGLLTAEMLRDGAPLEVIAAPIFPGETEPVYRSEIIVRDDSPIATIDDALSGRFAVNEYGSWSGWRVWERHLAAMGRSADEHPTQVVSGGHTRSMDAVRSGVADVATIDSSIWNAAPEVDRSGLRVIGETRDHPAPPLSFRAGLPVDVRTALVEAVLAEPTWVSATADDYRHMLD